MRKKNIVEISVTAGLILVLLFIVMNVITKSGKEKPVAAKEAKITTEDSGAGKAPAEERFRIQEEETKNLELKRDPFTTVAIEPLGASSSSGIKLNGILKDEVSAMAIINDQVVKVGDRVGDNVVVQIKPDRVILNDGSRNFELKFEDQTEKIPHEE